MTNMDGGSRFRLLNCPAAFNVEMNNIADTACNAARILIAFVLMMNFFLLSNAVLAIVVQPLERKYVASLSAVNERKEFTFSWPPVLRIFAKRFDVHRETLYEYLLKAAA